MIINSKETQITPAVLNNRLSYDPSTGLLYWKECHSQSVQWNGRWANKEAFTTIQKTGYKFGRIEYWGFYAHRVIWAMQTGAWPKEQIDHIDGDRSNNAWINLREVTFSQNNMNASLPSHNSSGHIGVSLIKKTGKWEAHIGMPGKKIKKSLGVFGSLEEAVKARKAAESALNYHPNHGRKQ